MIILEANEDLQYRAAEYGRHLGLAFQLVDDLLDFVSSSTDMGKPVASDLKLGWIRKNSPISNILQVSPLPR